MSGLNTYTGATTVLGSVINFSTIANGGSPSGIGASTNAQSNLVIGSAASIIYTGANATTDRGFTILAGATGSIFVATSGVFLVFTGGSAATSGSVSAGASNGGVVFSGTYQNTGNMSVSSGLTMGVKGTFSGTIFVPNSSKVFAGLGPLSPGNATTPALQMQSSTCHLIVYSDGVSIGTITATAITGVSTFIVDLLDTMPAGTFTLVACTGTLPAGTPTIGTNSSGRTPTFIRTPGTGFQVLLV